MARDSSEKTIEQQLAEIDPGVIAKGQYLYLYARPTVRTTYWLLMVRNVYRPYTLDNELERPANRQATELALQYAALVFGCDYYIINNFSLDTRAQAYRPFPYREDLSHPIELTVVPDGDEFVAAIRNRRLGLTYDLSIPRPTPPRPKPTPEQCKGSTRSLKNRSRWPVKPRSPTRLLSGPPDPTSCV
jgi:hypothetical protein